jgi:hypothetical protein
MSAKTKDPQFVIVKAQPDVPVKGLEVWGCEWEDAHWDSGEYEKGQTNHRPVNYVSVGILLKDDDVGFAVATDICETGTFRGINFVPTKMVVRKWRIGKLAPSNRQSRSTPTSPASHLKSTETISDTQSEPS